MPGTCYNGIRILGLEGIGMQKGTTKEEKFEEIYRIYENEVFKIMRLFSSTYSDKKEKATNDFHRLSPCVDFLYKLSNKFIEDFERIMDFVEHKHIAL